MDSKEFRRIFLGEGQEPLTDELIAMLVKEQGIPEEDLKQLKKMGVCYCRKTNSFVTPPEMNF